MDVEPEVVLPSVNTMVASRPYFHLVDPAADKLPLYSSDSTPYMDDVPGTQTPIGNQYISPVLSNCVFFVYCEFVPRPREATIQCHVHDVDMQLLLLLLQQQQQCFGALR